MLFKKRAIKIRKPSRLNRPSYCRESFVIRLNLWQESAQKNSHSSCGGTREVELEPWKFLQNAVERPTMKKDLDTCASKSLNLWWVVRDSNSRPKD